MCIRSLDIIIITKGGQFVIFDIIIRYILIFSGFGIIFFLAAFRQSPPGKSESIIIFYALR